MLNFYASQIHYAAKLLPIWNAVPTESRGTFKVHPRLDGLIAEAPVGEPDQDGVLVVAAHIDSQRSTNPFIYVEHGAGQSYESNMWYSNSSRSKMLAALVPGPYCAEKTRQSNPDVPVFEIGAPHLAHINNGMATKLAFAFHWRCAICLESDTAFDEYGPAVAEIAVHSKHIIGTAHPKMIGEATGFYRSYGIEVVTNYDRVLSEAALLAADNTSLIYEAACLDIPVVIMNKSSWRRYRNWGLRFWDLIPGPQVDTPAELRTVIADHLIDGANEQWTEIRAMVTERVYGDNPFGKLPEVIDDLVQVAQCA